MLAVSIMGATPRFIFYLAAVIFFLVAAVIALPRSRVAPWWAFFVALGLAAAFIPPMWDALAAT